MTEYDSKKATASKRAVSSHPVTTTRTQQEAVDTPLEDDILCGRGNVISNHIGNQRFQIIIAMKLQSYDEANRNGKTKIVLSIVRDILNCGGRFLKKNSDGGWYDTGYLGARSKVAHSIRDALSERNKSILSIQQQQQRQQQANSVDTSATTMHSRHHHAPPVRNVKVDKSSMVVMKNFAVNMNSYVADSSISLSSMKGSNDAFFSNRSDDLEGKRWKNPIIDKKAITSYAGGSCGPAAAGRREVGNHNNKFGHHQVHHNYDENKGDDDDYLVESSGLHSSEDEGSSCSHTSVAWKLADLFGNGDDSIMMDIGGDDDSLFDDNDDEDLMPTTPRPQQLVLGATTMPVTCSSTTTTTQQERTNDRDSSPRTSPGAAHQNLLVYAQMIVEEDEEE